MEKRKMIFAMFMMVLVSLMLTGTEGTAWAKNSGLRPGLAKSTLAKDKIILEYEFVAPSVSKMEGYDLLRIEGLELHERVGAPIVPVRPVKVSIPFGKKVLGTRVIIVESEELPGSYQLPPGQEPYPLSYKGVIEKTNPDLAIYGKAKPWPGIYREELSTQSKRGYQIFLVNLFPVQYNPSTGKVSYAKKMRLEIDLGISKKKQIFRPTKQLKKLLEQEVDNPATIKTYPLSSADYLALGSISRVSEAKGIGEAAMSWSPGEPDSPLSDPNCPYYGENWEYIVITSPYLADSNNIPNPNYSFQALCDSKWEHGISAGIVDTNWIYANYDGTRPDGESDNQTKIRNFLTDAYHSWEAEYVLLGGTNAIVPARMFWVQAWPGSSYVTTMPVDMYYGCVEPNECTFDYDADGIYGEPTDGPDGNDVDLYAEIYVGRAPVEDGNEVLNFVKKTLAYDSTQDEYLSRAAMLGEWLGFGGVSQYAKNSMEQIRLGGEYDDYFTCGFEGLPQFITEGCLPGDPNCCWPLYDKDATWSESDLICLMNGGVHLFNHLGHANYTYDMRLYTSDLASLTNTDYFFAYSQGCMPGGFDTTNCFAEVITSMEHGAFAVVMNARYGWGRHYSTDGPSQRFDRQFWDAVICENMFEIGRANQDSKEDNDWDINGECIRWCYYELNLFGDPETKFRHFVTSKGHIRFDKDYYNCSCEVGMSFIDSDLAGQGTWEVNIVTGDPNDPYDLETVSLEETDPNKGIFAGTIWTDSNDPNAGDGRLQVYHDAVITVIYEDANDGTGNSASPNDTAIIDCVAPIISDVNVDIIGQDVTVTFQTDVDCFGCVLYGLDCNQTDLSSTDWGADHSIKLWGVSPWSDHYFKVTATDIAGNEAVDDNDGNCYTFTTDGPNDIYVPADCDTIQEAIDCSWDGGTVIIAEGNYYESNISFKGKAITVRSTDSNDYSTIESTIIDANGGGEVFKFLSKEGVSSVLTGLTLRNNGSHYCIRCGTSCPLISNCIIENSQMGIFCSYCQSPGPTIKNNIIRHNGMGIFAIYATATARNNTIVDNTIYGIIANFDSSLTVSNCILWDNSGDVQTCSVTYSCIEDNYPGEGNIHDDPCFVDAANGDYHIGPNSPCIDAGDPNAKYTGEVDIDGEPRVMHGRVDMGADEFTGPTVHNVAQDNWYTSIQSAINNASNGNVIMAYPNTYDESINFIGKAITVTGTDPNDLGVVKTTIISADSSTAVLIPSNTGSALKGFTVKQGFYGVQCTASSPVISNCIIENNGDAGIFCQYCYSTGPTVKNNIIRYNDGGIRALYTNVTIRNNTIVDNTSYGITANCTNPVISNCILWNNNDELSGYCSATYSCIEDLDGGDGNIHDDPCFVDDGYHLSANSPCIDVGDPCGDYDDETDIDGDERVIDIAGKGDDVNDVDMGADEYKSIWVPMNII